MLRRPSGSFQAAAVGMAAVLLAGACRGSTDPGGGGGRPGSTTPTPLTWTTCGPGVQCATLAVPVDPGRPDGPTIELGLARRPAADTDGRLGSVVINPGGPGASGVDLVRGGGVGVDVLERFDAVSWDPRGVGRSRPLDCEDAVPAYRRLDWTPDDPTETAALDDQAQRLAAACRLAAGPELAAHLATDDTVADLDRLRVALGEDRLNYLGLSYGTAIGLRYAAHHADRLRAMVLDGVADPREDLVTTLGDQARALETQVEGVLGERVALYDRVAGAAEAGRAPVDPTTLAYAAIAACYDEDGGPALAAALAEADQGRGGPARALADSYWSQSSYGAYMAAVCSDQAHPEGPAAYDRLVTELARSAPRFGAVVANELRPCAWWPAASPSPAIAAPGSPPILVLGNTGDVATPYHTATRVAEDLDHGVLLTYVGQGHTSIDRSPCIDGHLKRYLEALAVPPPGTRCT